MDGYKFPVAAVNFQDDLAAQEMTYHTTIVYVKDLQTELQIGTGEHREWTIITSPRDLEKWREYPGWNRLVFVRIEGY